jgi:hypothetical protein
MPDSPHDQTALASAWSDFCTRLGRSAELIFDPRTPKDPQVIAAGHRYLLSLLNTALEISLGCGDPKRPEIGQPQDLHRKWAMDNPDAKYGWISVEPGGEYLVTGHRGTARYLGFSLTAGKAGVQLPMRVVANLTHRELRLDPDGTFRLYLGGTPRAEDTWLPLEAGVSALSIRQFFYDWDTEQPAQLRVERLDLPCAPEPASVGQLQSDLESVLGFFDHSARFLREFVEKLRTEPNTFQQPPPAMPRADGLLDNVSSPGWLVLGPDEAAVIEIPLADCEYWGIRLGNYWYESLDYVHRQTSLNGHQATADPDGVVRVVVAAADPGAANWLDSAGHRELAIAARWQLVRPPTPLPTVTVLPASQIGAHLPRTTARITPAERQAQLRDRAIAVRRRFGR